MVRPLHAAGKRHTKRNALETSTTLTHLDNRSNVQVTKECPPFICAASSDEYLLGGDVDGRATNGGRTLT